MPVIVFTGDSHTSGMGAPNGRSWPDQMAAMIGQVDLRTFNVAAAGMEFSGQVELWAWRVAPVLAEEAGARIIFGMGGYNDIRNHRADADAILALHRRQCDQAHAARARYVAGLDVIRADQGDPQANLTMVGVNERLRRHPAEFCDEIVDFGAYEPFARLQGPYEPSLFDSDLVHLNDRGQTIMAAIARPVFEDLLGTH